MEKLSQRNHFTSSLDLSGIPLNLGDIDYIQLYANGMDHAEIQQSLSVRYNRMKKALVKLRDHGHDAYGYTSLVYYCFTRGLIV